MCSGVLVIDKPKGMTSFAAVKVVRKALGVKKVGHTGTLDPMATGVLPMCIGEATKIAGLLTSADKVYSGVAELGLTTNTLDITGEVLARGDTSAVRQAEVEAAMGSLVGDIMQTPPQFSALRSGGQRAHKLARRGQVVELDPRPVRVHRFELKAFSPPSFEFLVECGKGTYVRSLVESVGERLGCGATLTELRRLKSGNFTIESAIALEAVDPKNPPLFGIDVALGALPAVDLDPDQAVAISHGQPVDVPDGRHPELAVGLIRLRCAGRVVALGELRAGRLWPKRGFRHQASNG